MNKSSLENIRRRLFKQINKTIQGQFRAGYPNLSCTSAGWLRMRYSFSPTWNFVLTVHETVEQSDYLDISVVMDDSGQKLVFMDSVEVSNPRGIHQIADSCAKKINECILSKSGRKMQ